MENVQKLIISDYNWPRSSSSLSLQTTYRSAAAAAAAHTWRIFAAAAAASSLSPLTFYTNGEVVVEADCNYFCSLSLPLAFCTATKVAKTSFLHAMLYRAAAAAAAAVGQP